MSSEFFVFENSFFSDPFSPFPIDEHLHFPLESDDAASNLDQIASALLSSSPPSVELQNLSLLPLQGRAENSVKTEECQLSFSRHDTALKLMQRSYSSNSFDNTSSFPFHPQFGSILEHHPQIFSSPETTTQMRKVCSTGDLQKMRSNMQERSVVSLSPLSAEEANFKVGRYSAEERKERIDRYRAKRTQRNFNKTIKYACRKTLADTRPRIRGRFARNDEAGEMPRASMFQRYEDDDDLWMSLQMEGLHEDDERAARTGPFFNVSDCNQYHNYSY